MKVELETVRTAFQLAKEEVRKDLLTDSPDDLALKTMTAAVVSGLTELELEIMRLAIDENGE